jgi:hypothetical protein
MKREEFIEWLENDSCFEKRSDNEYKSLVNYAEFIYELFLGRLVLGW